MMRYLAGAVLGAIIAAGLAHAATIHVPADQPTIQAEWLKQLRQWACRGGLLGLLGLFLLIVVPPRPAVAGYINDQFDGDSLPTHWHVSGATGIYSVSGGFLHVTDIDPAVSWSDMIFTADFAAAKGLFIAVGFAYPTGPYKKFGMLLFDRHNAVVGQFGLEDSPSDWIENGSGSCYELVPRDAIPSWVTIGRAGTVLTVQWAGYAPFVCGSTDDTVSYIQLVFSRYSATQFTGVSIDSFYAASSNPPIVESIKLSGDTAFGHVVDHVPYISWVYSDEEDSSQSLAEVQVGSDGDWGNGAEMWDVQVMGDSSGVTYTGSSLVDGHDYWMRVRANDGEVWGLWHEQAFHMNSIAVAPFQVFPEAFGSVVSVSPTLKAIVSLDTEGDPQRLRFAIIMDDSIVVDESQWLPPEAIPAGDTVSWAGIVPLLENGSYIWAVKASDGFEETSYWSAWRVFFVNAIEEPPAAPVVLTPTNDSIVYALYPEFIWATAHDPDPLDSVGYDYQVSLNSIFSPALELPDLSDTVLTLFTPLEIGTRYWWRVLSTDNHGSKTTSLAAQFRVYVPGDVNRSSSVTSADIIALVNYVFKGQALTVPECAGDVNSGIGVTSSDIIYLVNAVFKGGQEPLSSCD